jgi:hypothetical protein
MEAIAAGVDARGRHVLWVGDTGDNQAVRSTVSVYELPEPEELRNRSVTPTRYSLRYSRPQDAEALIADPDEDQLWLISKGILGGSVWEVPRPMRSGDVRGLRKIGQEGGLVTDAAMAPDGSRYAVRDYTEVRIYEGKPVGELIARMPLPDQVQGEAMTWAPDGRSLLVASESDDRLLRVDLPEEAWMHSALPQPAVTEDAAPDVAPTPDATTPGDATGAAPSPAPVANPVLEPVDRVGGLAVMALAIGAGVFVLSAIAVAVVARVRSPRS